MDAGSTITGVTFIIGLIAMFAMSCITEIRRPQVQQPAQRVTLNEQIRNRKYTPVVRQVEDDEDDAFYIDVPFEVLAG